jgi:hypothetical protein
MDIIKNPAKQVHSLIPLSVYLLISSLVLLVAESIVVFRSPDLNELYSVSAFYQAQELDSLKQRLARVDVEISLLEKNCEGTSEGKKSCAK